MIVNWKGRGDYYPGTVTHVRGVEGDSTFAIVYDDGETESGVALGRIAALPEYTIGDLVMVNCKGHGTYYPGKITKMQSSHSFTILYNDGGTEANVGLEMIKHLPPEAALSTSSTTTPPPVATVSLSKDTLRINGNKATVSDVPREILDLEIDG